jgi:hypothetical protein
MPRVRRRRGKVVKTQDWRIKEYKDFTREMERNPAYGPFHHDPTAGMAEEQRADYLARIANPRWLEKISLKTYDSFGSWYKDMRMMFDNCLAYNEEWSLFSIMAHHGKHRVEQFMKRIMVPESPAGRERAGKLRRRMMESDLVLHAIEVQDMEEHEVQDLNNLEVLSQRLEELRFGEAEQAQIERLRAPNGDCELEDLPRTVVRKLWLVVGGFERKHGSPK